MIRGIRVSLVMAFMGLLLLAIAFTYVLNWLFQDYMGEGPGQYLSDLSPPVVLVTVVMTVPILETYVGIVMPYSIMEKLGIINKYIKALLASVFFGILHFYSWPYAILGLAAGLFMNTLYIYAAELKYYPFWVVTIFHALYNLYGFLFVV